MAKRKMKKSGGDSRSTRALREPELTVEQLIAQPYLRARPAIPRASDLVVVLVLVGPIAYALGRLPLAVLAIVSALQVLITTTPLPGRLAQPGRAVGAGLVVALAVGIVLNKPPEIALGIVAGIVATIPLQLVWLQLLPKESLSLRTGVFLRAISRS